MTTYEELLAKNLENADFNELYTKTRPLFEIKKKLIKARIDAGLSLSKDRKANERISKHSGQV